VGSNPENVQVGTIAEALHGVTQPGRSLPEGECLSEPREIFGFDQGKVCRAVFEHFSRDQQTEGAQMVTMSQILGFVRDELAVAVPGEKELDGFAISHHMPAGQNLFSIAMDEKSRADPVRVRSHPNRTSE
jgi:hypothetical protein